MPSAVREDTDTRIATAMSATYRLILGEAGRNNRIQTVFIIATEPARYRPASFGEERCGQPESDSFIGGRSRVEPPNEYSC